MPKYLKFILSVSVFIFTSYSRGKGPESGGGGGVVFIADQPQLIDYYTIPGATQHLSQKYKIKKSSTISSNFSFSLKKYSDTNDPAFALASQTLSAWMNLPFDYIGLVIGSAMLGPIQWHFVDDTSLSYENHFRPALLSSESKIKTAAYYQQKPRIFDVFIVRNIWNQLPIHHQAGLVIHESLRHVQIGYIYHFNDEALQKATAIMMTCKPTIKLNQYINFLLANQIELAEKNIGRFETLTHECWK